MSTRDIGLDPVTHDLSIVPGSYGYTFRLVNEAERVAQQIKIRLLTLIGEWFLDVTHGVPYLEEVMVKNPRPQAVEAIFRGQIMAVPGVRKVARLALDYDPRQRYLHVDFQCDTIYGSVTEQIQAPVVATRGSNVG